MPSPVNATTFLRRHRHAQSAWTVTVRHRTQRRGWLRRDQLAAVPFTRPPGCGRDLRGAATSAAGGGRSRPPTGYFSRRWAIGYRASERSAASASKARQLRRRPGPPLPGRPHSMQNWCPLHNFAIDLGGESRGGQRADRCSGRQQNKSDPLEDGVGRSGCADETDHRDRCEPRAWTAALMRRRTRQPVSVSPRCRPGQRGRRRRRHRNPRCALPRAELGTFPGRRTDREPPSRYGSARGVEVCDLANPRDHSGGRSPF